MIILEELSNHFSKLYQTVTVDIDENYRNCTPNICIWNKRVDVAWNNALSKIFKTHWCESVKPLQFLLLSFSCSHYATYEKTGILETKTVVLCILAKFGRDGIFLTGLNSVCWTQTNNVHGFSGVSKDFTSLYECQTACIDDSTCVAIDWEPSNTGKSCWILTSTVAKNTMDIGVITHYELNRSNLG